MNFKKMKKRFFSLSRGNGGFTLVELIVVIAILAILGGVAVPAYSGYVEKAKLAGDEQLLAAVNTAFAAACAENGTDTYNVPATPSITLSGEAGAKTVEEGAITSPAGYDAAFQRYFSGNGDAKFEVFTSLFYDQSIGGFAVNPLANLLDLLSPEDIAALEASGFITADGLGIENLLGKVDFVSTLAASLAQAPGNGEMYGNAAYEMMVSYMGELMTAMGYGPEQGAEFEAKLTEMVTARSELVDTSTIEGYESMTADEQLAAKFERAQYEILANNLVLQAAKNLPAQDSSAVLNEISNTKNFVDLMKDENTGITNAAMAYGLYTAYAHNIKDEAKREEAIKKTEDPLALLKAMDDPDFRTYLKNEDGQAQKDLDGYISSMNMINSAQQNKDAVESILVNGFADPSLAALLQQSMNKK